MAIKKTKTASKKASTKTTMKSSTSDSSKTTKKNTNKIVKKSNDNTNTSSDASKSYKELITEALIALKEPRKGSSRQSLKKFIKEKYPKIGSSNSFDNYFNSALKKGVDSDLFLQPKGPSGPVKLNTVKKETSPVPKQKKDTSKSDSKKVTKKTTTTTTSSKKSTTPKKSSSTTTKKSSTSTSSSTTGAPTYKDMITKAITSLNNGKGSSRVALKKYIKDNYSNISASHFDHLFNSAIRKGVESGLFSQPKGPAGVVKVSKKTSKISAK